MTLQPGLSAETYVPDHQRCWMAVLTRDRSADGRFVYAVRSTGIYCRPSCPARRPRRDRVAFFACGDDAERAGYRPCRRCRPQDGADDPQTELARRVCRYIDAHTDDSNTLADLGSHVNLSPHHLQRLFKRMTGISPRQYADARRLGGLKKQLAGGASVTEALYEAGYSSSSRLYERASGQLGMTPGTYRKGGRGMRIGYTITDCPLGRLLLAATDRGICAVSLGDSDVALEAALRREFPRAELHRNDGGLCAFVRAVVDRLDAGPPSVTLPLDIRATAFQWRVWEALRAIPCGSVRSYGEIARSLGQPGAARAVASACAANPVALVIPCHRAVRQDGGLGGYRWGVERKRALLAGEAAGDPAATDTRPSPAPPVARE